MKTFSLLVGLSVTTLLAACGGGGSSSSGAQSTSSVNGVVAYGAPVAGTQVIAIDSQGKQCGTATTDSTGRYTMTTTCAAGAVIFSAAGTTPGGAPLDALAFPGSGQTRVSGTVNLTPLTTLTIWYAIGNLNMNLTGNTQVLAMAPSLVTAPNYLAASDAILSVFSPLLTIYGIDASDFDPVRTVFLPNGLGIDGFFDDFPLTLSAQTTIQIATSSNPGSPLLVITFPTTPNSPPTISGSLADLLDNSGTPAPTDPTPGDGTIVASTPDCVMAADNKTYVSCNGFTAAALKKDMTNYIAEFTVNGSTSFVNVHSHDPAFRLTTVGAGDSWSSGTRPNAPDYYIHNSGETANYTWTVSNTGGSLGLSNYDIVIPPFSEVFTNVQVFLGNIKSQLNNSLHGKLVRGNACRVAGIDGTTYSILVTSPINGEFVHSSYCVGAGGGPLLSITQYLNKDVLAFTWTVTQVGNVPVQSPPTPLTKL